MNLLPGFDLAVTRRFAWRLLDIACPRAGMSAANTIHPFRISADGFCASALARQPRVASCHC